MGPQAEPESKALVPLPIQQISPSTPHHTRWTQRFSPYKHQPHHVVIWDLFLILSSSNLVKGRQPMGPGELNAGRFILSLIHDTLVISYALFCLQYFMVFPWNTVSVPGVNFCSLSQWCSVSLVQFFWVIYYNGALINCSPNCSALAEGKRETDCLSGLYCYFSWTSHSDPLFYFYDKTKKMLLAFI